MAAFAFRYAMGEDWARLDSNQGPRDYESPALPLSYRPSASFRINTANDCDQPRKRPFQWDTPTPPDRSALRLQQSGHRFFQLFSRDRFLEIGIAADRESGFLFLVAGVGGIIKHGNLRLQLVDLLA